MKRFFYILLFLTSGLHAQQLFPLLDSANIAKALDGRKDVRIRTVKNGNDPLKDIRLSDLFKSGCKLTALQDSGWVRLSCDTIKGNDILIKGVTWLSDSSLVVDSVKLSAGAGISIGGGYPNYTITNIGDLSDTNEIELPIQTGQNGKFLKTDGTSVSWQSAVTSIDVSVPDGLTVSGVPITTSGTIALGLNKDLSALEGLSGTGFAVRTANNTWALRSFGVSAGQLTISNYNGVAGNVGLGLATTSVTAAKYGSRTKIPTFTVDQFGRLTFAADSTLIENQRLSLLPSGGTLKLTRPGFASDFVTLPDSSSTNEIELPIQTGQNGKFLKTDGTSPSWATAVTSIGISTSTGLAVSGSPVTTSGTIALSPANDLAALEGLSNDGYAVRIGTDTWAIRGINGSSDISVTNGNGKVGNTAIDLSNTAVTAGTYGGAWKSNKITFDAKGRATSATEENIADSQHLTLLASGGTLKLTKNIGGVTQASAFVQLPDSSSTNEGKLSAQSISGTKSAIKSNTPTSASVVLKTAGGITTSVSADTITLTGSGGAFTLKEAKKKDRLGIIVATDSVGFDYKKLPKVLTKDTLGWIPYYDSAALTNKKIDVKRMTYTPYIDLSYSSTRDYNIAAGVDSTMRWPNLGFSYRFTYSGATGRAKYVGTQTMIMKVDAGLNFKWTSGGVSETIVKLWKKYGGTSTLLQEVYVEPSTGGYWQNVDLSRVLYVSPGDEYYVTVTGDAARTVRVRGYMNIIPITIILAE